MGESRVTDMMMRCDDCGAEYEACVVHLCPNVQLAARIAALEEHREPRVARAVRETRRATDALEAALDAIESIEEVDEVCIGAVRDDLERARTNALDAFEALQRRLPWPSR